MFFVLFYFQEDDYLDEMLAFDSDSMTGSIKFESNTKSGVRIKKEAMDPEQRDRQKKDNHNISEY